MPAVAAMLAGGFERIVRPGIESPVQIALQPEAIVHPVEYAGFYQGNVRGLVRMRAILKYPHGIEPQFISPALSFFVNIVPGSEMVQLGNPYLQPFVAVRSLYRVHSPERRGVPVHVLRSLSPTCHI